MSLVNARSMLSSRSSFRFISRAGAAVFLLSQLAASALAGGTPSATSLSVSVAGKPVTAIASGTVVTLTAQ